MATIHESLESALGHHQAGRLEHAEQMYREVLEVDPNQPDALHLLGVIAYQEGRHEAAARQIRRAIELRPQAAAYHNNLGSVYDALRKPNEAIATYRRALEIAPSLADAHNNLGCSLRNQQRADEAIACFRRALAIKPDFVGALCNLASLCERLNRLDEAASTAAEGLRAAPDHPAMNLVVAKLDGRQGRIQAAIDRVQALRARVDPASDIAQEARYLLGRLYDRAGDARRAFEHSSEANHLARRREKDYVSLKRHYESNIDALGKLFHETWVARWSPSPPLGEGETPVFLTGFARSGTTLLEAILGSHPRIQTLDEKLTVHAMHQETDRFPGGFAGSLADLSTGQFEQLRAAYFRTVDDFVDRRPGNLLIDRNPMNTVMAGFLLRVFPAARFLVAVRHPCDVCLSCFMQDFKLNEATAHFYALEDAAMLYAKAMDLWRQYVRVVPHPYHMIRYEDLVDDCEAETRRVLEFLGVEWDDALLRHVEHAGRRGMISTPSYSQVTEPIYRRARYRWRRYAEQLAPVMDVLKPYIELFGYSSSDE